MKRVCWVWVVLMMGCWSQKEAPPVVLTKATPAQASSKKDVPVVEKPSVTSPKVPAFKVPAGEVIGASFEFKGREDGPVPMSCVRRPMNRRSGMACYKQYRRRALDGEQARQLVRTLRDGAMFDDDAQAACFDPRMGFAWYDQKGEALLQVGVCLKCNNVRVEGVDEKGQPVRWVSGLSVQGVETLRRLCHQLGLSHCKDRTYLEKMRAAEAAEDDIGG